MTKFTAVYVDEDDIATYIVKAATDPRTMNKTVYIRPPHNILSQRELIQKWEALSGKVLEKNRVSAQDFLTRMKGKVLYNIYNTQILYIMKM